MKKLLLLTMGMTLANCQGSEASHSQTKSIQVDNVTSETTDVPEHILEARTFCAEERWDGFGKNTCVTFFEGKALWTPAHGFFASHPFLSLEYELDGRYVRIKNSVAGISFNIQGNRLAAKAGDFVERMENPYGVYELDTEQRHYLFIDASQVDEDFSISLIAGPTNYADDCSPEMQILRVKAGSKQTHRIVMQCGRSYGTFLEGKVMGNNTAFEFSTLNMKQLECQNHIEGLCQPIQQVF